MICNASNFGSILMPQKPKPDVLMYHCGGGQPHTCSFSFYCLSVMKDFPPRPTWPQDRPNKNRTIRNLSILHHSNISFSVASMRADQARNTSLIQHRS